MILLNEVKVDLKIEFILSSIFFKNFVLSKNKDKEFKSLININIHLSVKVSNLFKNSCFNLEA